MQWSSETIDQLESIAEQISGEARRTQPGADDGLLPLYSLLGDLTSDLPKDPAISAVVDSLEATLTPLIEEARFFDPGAVAKLLKTSESLEQLVAELRSGETPAIQNASSQKSPSPLDSLTELPELESHQIDVLPAPEIEQTADSDDLLASKSSGEETPPLQRTDPVESVAQQFSGALILAEEGSDEGLLPMYRLVSELASLLSHTPSIHESIRAVCDRLEDLLNSTGRFSRADLDFLTEFNVWLGTTHHTLSANQATEPFQPSASHALEDSNQESANSVSESPDSDFTEFDAIMDLNLAENEELLTEFQAEATDHLGQIESAVLELEQNAACEDAINALFRSFHTLKGVASFLNLIPINRLAHEIEDLMDLVRSGKLVIFKEVVDLVLDCKDAIAALIDQISEALSNGSTPNEVIPVSSLMTRARLASQGQPAYQKSVGFGQSNDESNSRPSEQSEPDAPKSNKVPKTSSQSSTIRVNTRKLDNLLDMVGELVIVNSQLTESPETLEGESNSLRRSLSQLARITKELRHTSMSLRMVPIKPTFQKMSRLARDISGKIGKPVNLEVAGEDTELDRNVVEMVGDPLVHMTRNAIDHGLESPEDRIDAGKPEAGHIRISAYHSGSNIAIEISDDGRGIDPEKVLAKALSKGIVDANANLSNQEIFKLIFAPGFSTAAEVTDISGRGVGMDVVRKNIENLRGKVEIESEIGAGSTFRILLPLTMAIIYGLVVKVGDSHFILSSNSVKVALRPDEASLTSVQGKEEVLIIRDKVYPLKRLHKIFGIQDALTNPKKGVVVIVESNDREYGLLVDAMVQKQEVVIKSLGSMMQNLSGISGGAILDDGSIALILDTRSLTGTD